MHEERPFYCEKTKRNCPFDSKFRYCFDCDPPKCLIKNEETGEYLTAIYLGCKKAVPPLLWKKGPSYAIPFENEEEAKATITFIGAVINWELEEQLEVVELQE